MALTNTKHDKNIGIKQINRPDLSCPERLILYFFKIKKRVK
jgi:hypothetical protein